mmetsp:Transcript_10798/g.27490  ORF Transcript_10798/g.27490 Transcript_10798/m.27490 type:complete len:236 (-) Transcript_10798:222-929(-)
MNLRAWFDERTRLDVADHQGSRRGLVGVVVGRRAPEGVVRVDGRRPVVGRRMAVVGGLAPGSRGRGPGVPPAVVVLGAMLLIAGGEVLVVGPSVAATAAAAAAEAATPAGPGDDDLGSLGTATLVGLSRVPQRLDEAELDESIGRTVDDAENGVERRGVDRDSPDTKRPDDDVVRLRRRFDGIVGDAFGNDGNGLVFHGLDGLPRVVGLVAAGVSLARRQAVLNEAPRFVVQDRE